jgi:hypothetical protein
MQSKTAKLVNHQRVIELLECYGGDAANWPEEERAAASALIKGSAELQQRQRDARQLDEAMDMAAVQASFTARPDAATVANIIAALPEQTTDNTTRLSDFREQQANKHGTKRNMGWWTYGAAAAAVMVLAIGILVRQPSQPLQPSTTQPLMTAEASQQELDQWMWQEATGLDEEPALDATADDADAPITFMAMVELDLQPGEE